MTILQKLQLKQSEIRESINSLLGNDSRSETEQGELEKLTGEAQGLEVELRAAIVASPDPDETQTVETEDAEIRQRRELSDQSDLARIYAAVIEHRQVDGRERELQTEFGLTGNQIPLSMLRGEEHRAVTPAPGNVGQNQSEIIPYIFPQSVAAFLMVDMPTVGVGEAVFPVLTKKLDVRTPAESGVAAETTGSFSAEVLSPARLQAAFFYSREDRARFAGMDASLRQNLSAGLSDGLDQQVIAGGEGLLDGTNLDNHNVSTETTYALYRSQLGYGRVDGRFASSIADIRLVMGSATYGHAAGEFRSNNAGDRAALEDLSSATGGVRVSAHVPAVASNKQNVIVRRGMRRDMVVPIWEGISLVPDPVTGIKKGEISITAIMLHAVKIIRAAGFYKQQTQHA